MHRTWAPVPSTTSRYRKLISSDALRPVCSASSIKAIGNAVSQGEVKAIIDEFVARDDAAHGVASYGFRLDEDEQRRRWLPDMIGGELLGGYCLSEPHSGSDAAALITRAVREGDDYVVNGTKAWITHGGVADFYSAMVRTSDDGPKGITCLLVPGDAAGLSAAAPERKMGANASPTAQVIFDDVHVSADRVMGTEGGGFTVALAALDAGRLGIAACAVGLAQAALDAAVAYAADRQQFGRSIIEFQGVAFMLADMATAVAAARALYVDAARLKDAVCTAHACPQRCPLQVAVRPVCFSLHAERPARTS